MEIKKEDILKRKEEERKLEISSSPLGKTSEKIKESVSSGGSILDKLLNFGGLILAGILVNNLPGIIDKVKEIIDSIVNFLTPIQSGFNLIKAFFTGEIDESQYDVDKKRFDDALANINEEGGLIDQLAEKAGPLEGLIKTLKPAIELVRNKIGGNKTVLAKKGGKEGVLNKETGEFTERQFTSAERQKYSDQSKEKLKKRTERGSGMASFRQDAAENATLQESVRGQTSEGSPTGQVSSNTNITPLQQQALGVLAKYESGVHGYEAVNQIGTKGGRGVLGFSGSFTNMKQHGGISLTSLTIGDIKKLQYDDGSMTNQQWISAGKLHAVGRYQFIGNTLPGVAKRAGIPDSAKFDSNVQDLMALQLMKERGISPWVGPSDKATAEERRIVEQARKQPITYNMTTSKTEAKITPAPNNKGDQVKVLNQPDPRKNRRGRTVAVQRVNTIQTALVPMPIPMKSSPSSVSQPQLPSIWST